MVQRMKLNADFSKKVVVRPEDYVWVPSPVPGVERMMLDRIGEEVARATSLVRYEPDSSFTSHTHSGGEEFYVVEGVFSDEHGSYPRGSYVRNPVGTKHSPQIGLEGAMIFVKLLQFQEGDREQKAIQTLDVVGKELSESGVRKVSLHSYEREEVSILEFEANRVFVNTHTYLGQEILIVEGELFVGGQCFREGSWIRDPEIINPNSWMEGACTKEKPLRALVKKGHLDYELTL